MHQSNSVGKYAIFDMHAALSPHNGSACFFSNFDKRLILFVEADHKKSDDST